MQQPESHYFQLLDRYLKGNCSPAEAEELMDFLGEDASNRVLLQSMQEQFKLALMQAEERGSEYASGSGDEGLIGANREDWSEKVRENLLHAISESYSKEDVRPGKLVSGKVTPLYRRPWFRLAAAVLVLLCLTPAIRYEWSRRSGVSLHNNIAAVTAANNFLPAGNKATLTLSNGSAILLDSTHAGLLPSDGNTRISKPVNGQLVYQAINNKTPVPAANAAPSFNTLSTPKGGTYKVVLSDGTGVWLNAASSLRFPTVFNGNDRVVELNGEAYFEVAKRSAINGHGNSPFKVLVHHDLLHSRAPLPQEGMVVEVLGTHFDIMAYSDESKMNTSLLEGAVKVSVGRNARTLVPGQQAIVGTAAASEAEMIEVGEANTEAAIAWMNGVFQFDKTPIHTVMNQIARWYDVDIAYQGNTVKYFSGNISRELTLPQVLHIMETAGKVHFKLEGKLITVYH